MTRISLPPERRPRLSLLRLALYCVVALVLLALAMDSGTASAEECHLGSGSRECEWRKAVDLQASTAEEQLAAKYAPVVYLKEQEKDCDSDGEPYDPAPVDLVLENPDVTLRDASRLDEPVVIEAPSGADLFDKGEDFYLDFPGDPRAPGCKFEQDYKRLRDEFPRVAYAHIQREPGFPGLALQYYFFYYFNDWNNTHEGDWEMIQLAFDAESAEEALEQEPVRVAYAQHASGERADWDDGKVEKEDGRPVVYVAAGSHASHFEPAVYFGLGEGGAGFGCDHASGPFRREPLQARLLPDGARDPADPHAWLDFEGLWGEKDEGHWSGPRGPRTKDKWERPFSWEAGLRDASVKVPGGPTLAPNAIGAFCGAVSLGSSLLNAYTRNPYAVGGTAGLVFLAVVGVVYLGRTKALSGLRPMPEGASLGAPLTRQRDFAHILRASASIYRRNWRALLLVGAFYVPIGALTSGAYALITGIPPLEPVFALLTEHQVTELSLAFALGGVQAALAWLVVAGGTIASLAEIDAGRRGDFREAYRMVWQRLPSLLGAVLRSTFHVTLFALTVVGIPWAVQRTVRWYFVPQAVMLEGKRAKESLTSSANVVAGSWWRAFGITFVLGLISVATGPVVGILLLLFASASLALVNGVSALIHVALIPFVATALTLLYFDLKTRRGL